MSHKKKDILLFVTTWMEHEDIMFNKISQTEKTNNVCYHIYAKFERKRERREPKKEKRKERRKEKRKFLKINKARKEGKRKREGNLTVRERFVVARSRV